MTLKCVTKNSSCYEFPKEYSASLLVQNYTLFYNMTVVFSYMEFKRVGLTYIALL